MLCCRKRPPSPNEKQKSPGKGAPPANGKAQTPPPADCQTNGPNGVAKPEAVVLQEKPSPSRDPSPPKSPQRKSPSPQKESSPRKSPSPQKESPKKRSPSPQKESPKKKSPSPQKESPKKKSPSPTKEKSPESKSKAQSPGRGSPDKGQVVTAAAAVEVSPTKAASPDGRLPEAKLADFLQRLETTSDVNELLAQGNTLLQEAKSRQAAGGLDAKMSSDLTNLIQRLEAVTSRLETVATKGSAGASDGALAAAVLEYDEMVAGQLAEFLSKSAQIGGVVNEQAVMVKDAFQEQRDVITKASKAKKPDAAGLQQVFQPLSSKIGEIQEIREKNRHNKEFFNHLSMISEAIGALGWVAVSPTPAPHIKEMSDAGQFYSNRVLKDYKEKDKTHVEYVRAWSKTLGELQTYVKKTHTTGLTWNSQGVDVSTLVSGGAAPPAPAAGGPPPPPPPGPPPPPPPPANLPSAAEDDSEKARSQLFASLNQGTDITKSLRKVPDKDKTHKNPGLRKVADDQKTHKNTALRLASPVPYKPAAQSPKPVSALASKPVSKPPKTELDGKKWNIEYHIDNKNIVLDDVNMKQQVYIYRCQNSTIQVKGKVNSIVLDNCKKCAVVFETVVAALEAINCQSIQVQAIGKVPTISIDKTDGFQLYLNSDSLDTEIVSAKSSEMNILVPQADGEFKEYALPEQYKSTWGGSGFTTITTDINC